NEGPLPSWTASYLWDKGDSLRGVRYLLTFRPFAGLPAAVRREYLEGRLNLLPCPGSQLFWGIPGYQRLLDQWPFAYQPPLLHLLSRSEALHGLRIPQSGWVHEAKPGHAAPDDPQLALKHTYVRTHRWAKIHRHEDELSALAVEDKVTVVFFSTAPDDLGLYGKPMARNVQIWTHDFEMLLDGPRASSEDVRRAADRMAQGGLFGYRFQFPPERVGRHEIFWH